MKSTIQTLGDPAIENQTSSLLMTGLTANRSPNPGLMQLAVPERNLDFFGWAFGVAVMYLSGFVVGAAGIIVTSVALAVIGVIILFWGTLVYWMTLE